MIIRLKKNGSRTDMGSLISLLDGQSDLQYRVSTSEDIVSVVRHTNGIAKEIEKQAIVAEVVAVGKPYILGAKTKLSATGGMKLSDKVTIGGGELIFMAGPCSVENYDQIKKSAEEVAKCGGQILRGGAYKPRTSPYDFQGLGIEGLKLLREAADKQGLLVITEIMDVRDVDIVGQYADIYQVGTRNMQNYSLLKELGDTRKPVLLKRGMWATYKEFLLAAEYILAGGNERVILCERGIRTYVTETRFTMDTNAIPYLKKESHLPVVADPSHATGFTDMVEPIALSSVAAGCDGLIIEAHPKPDESISDKHQAIDFKQLKRIIDKSKKVAAAIKD